MTPKKNTDVITRPQFKLELVGLGGNAGRPDIAALALDAKNAVLSVQKIGGDGSFGFTADVLKQATHIVIGAADDKGGPGVNRESALTFSIADFRKEVADGVLALAEPVWSRWPSFRICVSGNVRQCRRQRWWFETLVAVSAKPVIRVNDAFSQTALFSKSPTISALLPTVGELLAWPVRCAPVCVGTVEVYRRTCCCFTIDIDDRRIGDLIRDLERFVPRLPDFPIPRGKFPPPPPPPLGDPLQTPYFKGGALNELALNAAADLHALRTLPIRQAAEYIEARPYLHFRICLCDKPVLVGSGSLHPDGTFNVCWRERLRLFRPNCSDQYAYVVKQTIGVTTRTIYDGVTAGAWFGVGEHPHLTTYDPYAFTCGETGPGNGDASVFLDLVGATESYELNTPASAGWDRVAAPTANSGLLFPNPTSHGHLRNLGGSVSLTFFFSLSMRALGAHFYRVSVTKADGSGNPVGGRTYLSNPIAWEKVSGLNIIQELLNPGPDSTMYRIPYSDEGWVGSVRYHSLIDTKVVTFDGPPASDLDSPSDNHLVTLELFDSAGVRLRPVGTPASGQPGAEQTKAFQFLRWFQPASSPGDDLSPVPFAALTHLFCWDNRPPVADITRLVKNGAASDEECQFLAGPGTANFAIEYRAYVAQERFQHSHGIGWLRGLNGSAANGGAGTLGTISPANVGKPPAAAGTSGSNSFATMLTRLDPPNPSVVLPRCAFAVTLTTFAKTTNGGDYTYPHVSETAAFALAIEP